MWIAGLAVSLISGVEAFGPGEVHQLQFAAGLGH